MTRCGLAFAVLAVASTSALHSERRFDYQARLINDLFRDYDKNILPQVNSSKAIDLELGSSVFSLDMTDKGELDAIMWVTMQWVDKRLAWDPKEYHDLQQIRVPGSQVWRPDIELYNSVGYGPGSFHTTIREANTNAIIYPSGMVLWIPPVNAKVLCQDQEFANWPWGEYECTLKLGSWTFSSEQINLKKFQDKNFLGTEEYGMDNSPVFFTKNSFKEETLLSKKYDCCPELYQSLAFRFKVQRRYQLTATGKETNPNELEEAFEADLW